MSICGIDPDDVRGRESTLVGEGPYAVARKLLGNVRKLAATAKKQNLKATNQQEIDAWDRLADLLSGFGRELVGYLNHSRSIRPRAPTPKG